MTGRLRGEQDFYLMSAEMSCVGYVKVVDVLSA